MTLVERHADRLKLKDGAGTVPGLWDANAIRRLIDNLAGNAVKYGTSDTAVTLSLTKLAHDQMEMAVHNEGNPLSQEDEEAICRPFYRTDLLSSGKDSVGGSD